MYFSGYRDSFVEEGSARQKNESVVMKAQKDLGSSGELEPLCAMQTMGNVSLVPRDFSWKWRW